jgi:putative flippase GtrA
MRSHAAEMARYAVNGLIATAVHYGVLTANLELLGAKSAGLANFVAALAGSMASFTGNRYFVFQRAAAGMLPQAIKFGGLYMAIALLHGFFLWIWTDLNGCDYRMGFLLATSLQLSLSYIGNKFLVFRA